MISERPILNTFRWHDFTWIMIGACGGVMNDKHSNDLKFHIGGMEAQEGWSVLDIVPGPHVDYVGNCKDLSVLREDSCIEVYALHVLENLSYNKELMAALREIYRVLEPGGCVRISVPDLEI